MDMKRALTHKEFLNREYMIQHLSYDREMAFYRSIQRGDRQEAMRLFQPLNADGLGILSHDKLRNLKYHLIITIAFITRYCIEGGLEMEEAYNLSDIYILRVDACITEAQIHAIHQELVEAYAERMQKLLKKMRFSKPVMQCIDYIYDNLHTKIKLEELADAVGLSPSYLSKLFHKEVGSTVTGYILEKKIDAAGNMLAYSEYSIAEITNYLCFSSESHFIEVFKKYMQMTPKEYRRSHFRTRRIEGNEVENRK
ncbi:MAG: AraC family transcriptional regulator [Lachnospiraceae bacterium]|nr:AraC family transcriptional regulator [Lachnospiraceae bacterium]